MLVVAATAAENLHIRYINDNAANYQETSFKPPYTHLDILESSMDDTSSNLKHPKVSQPEALPPLPQLCILRTLEHSSGSLGQTS